MVSRLVPSSWRNTLVGVAVASSLLLAAIHPSPAVAQGLRPVGHHIKATSPEHLSVVTLALNFEQTWRDSHLVYVGHGAGNHALFLGMRLNITTLPVAEAELMLDTAEAWLFDHEGLVESSAVVKEVEAFLRPDGRFVRLHDITLLAIEGLNRHDYWAVQLDPLPVPETALEVVSYRVDLVRGGNDWLDMIRKAPLARQGCAFFSVSPAMWSAQSNCEAGGIVMPTAPIFNAAGELAGFNLEGGEVVLIPRQVHTYLEQALAVEPEQKLSVTWGAIKKGAQ